MKKKKVLHKKITRHKPTNIFGLISLIVLALVVIGGVIGVASKSSYLRGKAANKQSAAYCMTLTSKTQCQDLTNNQCKWLDCPGSYSYYGQCRTEDGCNLNVNNCTGNGGRCIYNILNTEDQTLGCGPNNYTSYNACWVDAIKDRDGNEIQPGKCVSMGEPVGNDGTNARYCCMLEAGYLGFTTSACDGTGKTSGGVAPTSTSSRETGRITAPRSTGSTGVSGESRRPSMGEECTTTRGWKGTCQTEYLCPRQLAEVVYEEAKCASVAFLAPIGCCAYAPADYPRSMGEKCETSPEKWPGKCTLGPACMQSVLPNIKWDNDACLGTLLGCCGYKPGGVRVTIPEIEVDIGGVPVLRVTPGARQIYGPTPKPAARPTPKSAIRNIFSKIFGSFNSR